MNPDTGAVAGALRWLSSSPIRHTEGVWAGGVNRGYDTTVGACDYLYSEITGYAVSAHVCASRWTGEGRHLGLARQSAACLGRLLDVAPAAEADGAVLHGLTLPDLAPKRQYYTFDNAMCLQGLLDLHAVEPDGALVESATRIARWLVGMQETNGSFLAMYDADARVSRHPGRQFFDDHGALHAKHTIGLVKHWRAAGDDASRQAAVRVADWVLELQTPSGAFRANSLVQDVVTHAHCYAVEGLLYIGHVLQTSRWAEAAQRGARWLQAQQYPDGSVAIAYNRKWWTLGRRLTELVGPVAVTDATAQAVRIWMAAWALTGDDAFGQSAARGCRFLEGVQCVDRSTPAIAGGFPYAPRHPIYFAWPAMFAAQALREAAQGPRTALLDELF